MSDLSYFYERDLDKGTLDSFYNGLPNHLREKFKDSFGELTALDIDFTNFLQGYRGPYTNGGSGDSEYLGPCNGLQEVRHWWGASKKLLYIPVAGWVKYGTNRLFQDTDWHSLYFDSKTGECLSHNKNRAARKLNKKGRQLFREGKYAEAAEYHDNAYRACSSGYEHEQTFENDRDGAKVEEEAKNLNSQGEILFSEGKYKEAQKKYQQAYDKSQVEKEYNKYRSNVEKTKAKINAVHSSSKRDNQSRQSRYSTEFNEYERAYNVLQIGDIYNRMSSRAQFEMYAENLRSEESYYFNPTYSLDPLRMRAIFSSSGQDSPSYQCHCQMIEANVIRLNSEGNTLFSQRKYSEALSIYQEALINSENTGMNYTCRVNVDKAKAELDAMHLNSKGNSLFNHRMYAEALDKYQMAFNKSEVCTEYHAYQANIEKAGVEKHAMHLNSEGDALFSERKYTEALSKYEKASNKSKIREELNVYRANIENAKAEIDAMHFNSEGDALFHERNYIEALSKYEKASNKSKIGKERNVYRANIEKAKAEIDAMHFNSEGDALFHERKYTEALSELEKAFNRSKIEKERNVYRANIEIVKAEIDAMHYNSEGDALFRERKYTEALSKYEIASNKSKIGKELNLYRANIEKAKAEIDAMRFISEGDALFQERKYIEALSKYEAANNKSNVSKEYSKYRTSIERAKAEIEAINLCLEADNMMKQAKYGDALIKYQSACDKSLVEKGKMMNALSKNKALAVKMILSTLDTTWMKAWEAENDTASDRSDEAKGLFQRVLSDTMDSLKIFPDNLKFNQYIILASLKIDGNELFNEGLAAQQDGSKLLQEARKLQYQEKFDSALMKYKEAESRFSKAREKFETGREKDQRFASCIDFVQGQLDEVLDSIEFIEQEKFRSRLNKLNVKTDKSNNVEADSFQSDTTGDHKDYFKLI